MADGDRKLGGGVVRVVVIVPLFADRIGVWLRVLPPEPCWQLRICRAIVLATERVPRRPGLGWMGGMVSWS